MTECQTFVKNQMRLGGHDIPAAKLVCIDIQPYGTTQAPERDDILNIGGFGDAMFKVVSAFFERRRQPLRGGGGVDRVVIRYR